jgi:hypothetical protein
MGLFTDPTVEENRRQELLGELRGLRQQLAEVTGERDQARVEVKLADQIVSLKQQIVDLEIQQDRKHEEHEREKRETKHLVGLERKRQTFEIEQAKRETTLTVREENLAADRKRFEEQMTFTTDRFEREVGYLKELMTDVLSRLPKISADWELAAAAKSNGNGHKESADA